MNPPVLTGTTPRSTAAFKYRAAFMEGYENGRADLAEALALLAGLAGDSLAFATDPDGDCWCCGEPTGDPEALARDWPGHDAENPECPAAKVRAFLAAHPEREPG